MVEPGAECGVSGLEEHDNFFHDKHGYCYYSIEPGKKPVIFNLYVEPEYRRHGHARRILAYVIGEIRKAGYQGDIEIEVCPRENSILLGQLVAFYKMMGLEILMVGQDGTEGEAKGD